MIADHPGTCWDSKHLKWTAYLARLAGDQSHTDVVMWILDQQIDINESKSTIKRQSRACKV